MPSRVFLVICCCCLGCLECRTQPDDGGRKQRVAVIGGGVGGAAAAYYLRRERPSPADLDIQVFEREQLGGRAQELEYDGATIELGASIVWHKNHLVKDLADLTGLEREVPASDGLLAIYNGKQLVFAESPWRIITFLRLLFRYWLSWFTFSRAPAATYAKFEGIYALLDNGTAFDHPAKLLQAVGLYDLTQASMFEWLRETYGESADLLGAELIGGVSRVNYNQRNAELNALAGHVSMLPATEPKVFRIRGGNSQLASRVLQLANATVRQPEAVGQVARLPDGRFRLEMVPGGAGVQGHANPQDSDVYDAVIVAAPLEGSGLSFPGCELPPMPARKYQQVVTTIVKGVVRPSMFGLSDMPYDSILVTEDAPVPWSSLSIVGRTTSDNVTLWKLFSREPLPHAWMEMMFERGYAVVTSKQWSVPGAYPRFDPPEDFAPFRLADGLFYTAALENAASAMELAAIEGRMTALLAAEHLAFPACEHKRQQAGIDATHLPGTAASDGGAAAA